MKIVFEKLQIQNLLGKLLNFYSFILCIRVYDRWSCYRKAE